MGSKGLSNTVQIKLPNAFNPRPPQARLFNYIRNGGKQATVIWHRRFGKDYTSLAICHTMMALEPGTYWHIFPYYSQGREAIWDKKTAEGANYLKMFPIEILDTTGGRKGFNEQTMTVRYHPDMGGSIYRIKGGDNPNSLVGAGVKGVIYSEYDLMPLNTSHLIRPMIRETEGWEIRLFTPHGRNHGYDHWQRVKKLSQEEHYTELLTVEDTQHWTGWDIDQLIEEELNSGMSMERIQSEYWCAFDAEQEGSIYQAEMKWLDENKRIGKYEYDRDHPVNTSWDWGQDDHTAIWFFQIIDNHVVFIDFYTNHNQGMAHYAEVILKKPYVYGHHYVPHDLKQRDSNGVPIYKNARNFGIRMDDPGKKTSSVRDSIELVRMLLRRSYFNAATCAEGVSCLRSYIREFDEKTNRFTDKPKHDYSSHACDAIREAAQVLTRNKFIQKSRPSNYLKKKR